MMEKIKPRTRKWLAVVGVALLIVFAVLAVLAARLKPLLRERLLAAVREQYEREVELGDLSVSVWPFAAEGTGLVLHQKDRPGLPPLVAVKRLKVEASLRGVLSEPLRIERVTLEGLQIHVPPRQRDRDEPEEPKREPPRFVIHEVVADGTFLEILPKKEGKEPLTFDISKLALHSAGTAGPMRFRATLRNPRPPGDIESTGQFAPGRTTSRA